MEKIKIKQVRSRIGRPKDQKLTLDALGLTKMNKVQTIDYTNFGCELPFGGKYNAHIFPVYPEKDSCFTKWEKKNNYIIDYLKNIFN